MKKITKRTGKNGRKYVGLLLQGKNGGVHLETPTKLKRGELGKVVGANMRTLKSALLRKRR